MARTSYDDESETPGLIEEEVSQYAVTPPLLPNNLAGDDRYLALLTTALATCKDYKPKFGKGGRSGLVLAEFQNMYRSDMFYHWIGLDSPLMYAAHKAAGGMTSVYRQIGIGVQWIFNQVLQDRLGLSAEEARWSYTVPSVGKPRTLYLDGRIDLEHLSHPVARRRVEQWVQTAAEMLLLSSDIRARLKGAVFEVRQGYKSKDSKRQNADIANAVTAYTYSYLPVLLLLSAQIDNDVANRYMQARWLLLRGTIGSSSSESTYIFCRDVVGYDLADFFQRNSGQIRSEIEKILTILISP